MLPLLAAAAGIQTAYGLGQMIYGGIQARQAQADSEAAKAALSKIHYADYTQPYYQQLVNRAGYGLEAPQRQYMEQSADRAAGLGVRATEDRRAGLMGIGQQTQGLYDAYRNIGMADVNARTMKQQQQIAELQNRGNMSYQESMGLANLDYAEARARRQEANNMTQAGAQTMFNGLTPLAWSLSDQGGSMPSTSGGGQSTSGGTTVNVNTGTAPNSPMSFSPYQQWNNYYQNQQPWNPKPIMGGEGG